MARFKTRTGFLDSQEGQDIRQQLLRMMANKLYNTASSYSTNGSEYPDHLITFVDKHMNYLNARPKLEADKYLANLQLMTRIR